MKKLSSILIAALLLLTLSIPVSASANEVSLEEELRKLEEKYEVVEIIPYDTHNFNEIDETMKFESIEEFEEFIVQIIAEDEKDQPEISFTPRQELFNFATAATLGGSGSHSERWYAPIVGATFNWKTINFSYDYEHGSKTAYLTNVYDITSEISGFHIGISWTQTSTAGTIWTGSTAHLQVSGYYLGGAEILGVPVGVKVNATWDRSVTLDLPILA